MINDNQFKRILVRTALSPLLAMSLMAGMIAWQTINLVVALRGFDQVYRVSVQARTVHHTLIALAAIHQAGFEKPVDQALAQFEKLAERADRTFTALASAARKVGADSPGEQEPIRQFQHLYTHWADVARTDLRTARGHAAKLAAIDRDRRYLEEVNLQYFRFNESLGGTLATRCSEAQQYQLRVFVAGAGLALFLGGLIAWNVRRQMLTLRGSYTGVISQLSASNTRLEAGLQEATESLREQQLWREKTAMIDALTGLKNRACFTERLSEEFQRCRRYNKPLSVLVVDIDRFHEFNERYGMPDGDQMLASIGALLQSCCRTTDTIARYEGDAFAFLLPETDAPGAQEIAERIRRTVAGKVSERWSPTLCGGIASYRPSTPSEEALLNEAMMALHTCKTLGPNRILHHFLSQGIVTTTR